MTFDTRKYSREWQQRKRDAALAKRNHGRERCQKRHGRFGICGALLEYVDEKSESAETYCPACERQRLGVCRDCDSPVDGKAGKALRCAEHKHAATIAAGRRHFRRHHDKELAEARRSYQQNEAVRRRRNEYKRAWRKANRDKVRAQKRREALRQRARRTEYHRARRERERERLARRELNRYHGIVAVRTCLTCDTVVHGRVKKCVMCKAREAVIAKDHPSLGRGKGWRGVEVAA
jgi:hypothetical protein